jgi:hypothetical protein
MTVNLHVPPTYPLADRRDPGPMFRTRSRLAIARDIGILAVCIAIVVGFLAQVWRAPPPRAYTAPAVLMAADASPPGSA